MRYQILIIVLTLTVALKAAGSKSKAKITIQGYMLRNEIINIAAKAKAAREAENLDATARVQQLIALKIVQADASEEFKNAMEIINTTKPALEVDRFLVHASSYFGDAMCKTSNYFKLNSLTLNSWCAGTNDANQWIMIDAYTPVQFKIIATQGRVGAKQWVKTYKISYSEDGNTWLPYAGGKVFNGNWDDATIKYTNVNIRARKVKIHPVTWNGHVSMRVEAFTRPVVTTDTTEYPAITESSATTEPATLLAAFPATGLIPTIANGFKTARSSDYDKPYCKKWMLNETGENAWCAGVNTGGQYFEIGTNNTIPIHWVKIATKGREVYYQWVKSYKIMYNLDGIRWLDYEGGKIFTANTEESNIVSHKVNIKAVRIRIYPLSWNKHISMRIEAYYEKILNNTIPEEPAIAYGFPTAPSSSHDDPRCHKWMLNEPAENSSWCAKVADLNQYFEIGATNTLPIHWVKITTKGRENLNQWVKSYKIKHSNDGSTWLGYQDETVFLANYDTFNIVSNKIDITSKMIRIYPLTWNDTIAMKIEAYYEPTLEY